MKYLKQFAIDIMWLMLPFFSFYTLLIQIIFKPMSYTKFFFINAIILTIIIPLGYITRLYFVPQVILLNLSNKLGVDVIYVFSTFFICSLITTILLYKFFVSKESEVI